MKHGQMTQLKGEAKHLMEASTDKRQALMTNDCLRKKYKGDNRTCVKHSIVVFVTSFPDD